MFRETHRAFSVKFEVCDVIVRQRQLHIEEEKVELQLNMFQEFRDSFREMSALSFDSVTCIVAFKAYRWQRERNASLISSKMKEENQRSGNTLA